MPAVLIIDSTVHDHGLYRQYQQAVRPVIETHGGRQVVSSDTITPMSGGWEPTRIVVIEFPDMSALKACFASPEYLAIKHLREASCTGKVVVAES